MCPRSALCRNNISDLQEDETLKDVSSKSLTFQAHHLVLALTNSTYNKNKLKKNKTDAGIFTSYEKCFGFILAKNNQSSCYPPRQLGVYVPLFQKIFGLMFIPLCFQILHDTHIN